MRYYPVGLNLYGKAVLVVGAGRVAERKISSLLDYGARVKAVAPKATKRIRELSGDGKISLVGRGYRPSDLAGARLVVAATSDRKTNQKVYADARKRNIWVNVVDDKSLCDFISTAIIKKKGLVISVSSDGENPGFSKDFKEFLKGRIDEFDTSRHKS